MDTALRARDVVIGKFLRPERGSRIHAGARLVDDDVAYFPPRLFLDFLNQFRDKNFAFLAGGAVAAGDYFHGVLPDQTFQNALRFVFFILRGRGINHRLVEHLTRAVHNADFTARTECGIPAHGHFVFHGRLHEKRLEIDFEHFNRLLAGVVKEPGADFTLDGRRDQPVVPVLRGGFDKL